MFVHNMSLSASRPSAEILSLKRLDSHTSALSSVSTASVCDRSDIDTDHCDFCSDTDEFVSESRPWFELGERLASTFQAILDDDDEESESEFDQDTDTEDLPWASLSRRLSTRISLLDDTSIAEIPEEPIENTAERWHTVGKRLASVFQAAYEEEHEKLQLVDPIDDELDAVMDPSTCDSDMAPWSSLSQRLAGRLSVLDVGDATEFPDDVEQAVQRWCLVGKGLAAVFKAAATEQDDNFMFRAAQGSD